jgi:hypothetical protein
MELLARADLELSRLHAFGNALNVAQQISVIGIACDSH